MGIPGSANLLMLGGGAQAYQIEQSLRFDGSSYLQRTIPTRLTQNPAVCTLSVWIKRGSISDTFQYILEGYRTSTVRSVAYFDASAMDTLKYWYINNGTAQGTTGAFRDTSAWLHYVLKISTGTTSYSTETFINGVSVQSNSGPTTNYYQYPFFIGGDNNAVTLRVGDDIASAGYPFKGYFAEMHLVDGTALDADSFGEFDDNGVWRPIEYTGSYGTEGWYLKFDPSATNGIGHDHSGNGNDFTPTGFTTSGTGTDVMSDTPTTNWATLNPLWSANVSVVESEGNLQAQFPNAACKTQATMGMTSGKYYWEVDFPTFTAGGAVGVSNDGSSVTDLVGKDANSWAYFQAGKRRTNNVAVDWGSTWTGTDIIGVAFDADNGDLYFYKNGTAQESGAAAYTGLTNGPYYPAFSDDSGTTSSTVRVNFGQRAFAYTPPTGYSALNTANLPAPDIADGSQYFNTVLYTGNGSNASATQAITGVGFQPDFLWIKGRSVISSPPVWDVVRGVSNRLFTNTSGVENTSGDWLSSFDTDGFTVKGDANNANASGESFVAWNWKAGGSGSSNTAGSINSTVSANPSAGFSIVSYVGNNTAGATIGHGLGVKPDFIVVKDRDALVNWTVYHSAVGATKFLTLDTTNEAITQTNRWNNTEPTSTVFSVGVAAGTNGNSGDDYIAYCFAEVEGYSKFGSYTGNGSSDGVFVYTGHRPAWILLKCSSTAGEPWFILDTTRSAYNTSLAYLVTNSSQAEVSDANILQVDLLSNGFKLRSGGGNVNGSGRTYIFMSVAGHPLGGDGVSPATAR